MRMAVVRDNLNQMGGAERVVPALHEIFPQAPIFTTIVNRKILFPELREVDIRTSWMQNLPGLERHFKKYLPLYPRAIESLDLNEYDLLISSSFAFAKGILRRADAVHICYCYTVMRFVWDYENQIKREDYNFFYRGCLPWVIRRLQRGGGFPHPIGAALGTSKKLYHLAVPANHAAARG